MVSIKIGVRHTAHDNRFYFSFSDLFRTLFIDESPWEYKGLRLVEISVLGIVVVEW